MTVHVHAPQPNRSHIQELNAPVVCGYSKYRHLGLEIHSYAYEWYDPSNVVVTACGLAHSTWQRCTMKRKPCRKCYPEGNLK